jgi:hypothetical protein
MSASTISPTASLAELLGEMAASRGELEAFVAGLPPERLLVAGPDGWSIKDHLAHVAAWDGALLAVLRREPWYDGFGVAVDPGASFDAINARIRDNVAHHPLRQILAQFRGNRAALVATLRLLDPAALDQPLTDWQPGVEVPPEERLRAWVVDVTIDHDRAHLGWARAIASAA